MNEPSIALEPAQVRAGALVLSRAFFNDPFYNFTIPDVKRRTRILPWLFERIIRYAQFYGRVFTTPAMEGVAVWLGPPYPAIRLVGALRSELVLLPMHLRPRELLYSMRLSELADRLHRRSAQGAHWHLLSLGVEPGQQGKGVGQALLQPLLAQADRERSFCYLDTNNQQNLRYYQRFGFAVVCQGHAIPGGPHTWGMRRQASDGL